MTSIKYHRSYQIYTNFQQGNYKASTLNSIKHIDDILPIIKDLRDTWLKQIYFQEKVLRYAMEELLRNKLEAAKELKVNIVYQ